MIYPEFPNNGETIGICAPSAGVGGKLEYFDLSMDTLRDHGFNVYETDSVRSGDCPSASAEKRGDEFNSLFADNDVAMVMSATGGDYNIEMLPYINQELVKANPKWFAGYSDPTSIEILLTTVLDIATIYGCNAGAWDWRPLHDFQENSLRIISGEIIEQHSYDFYSSVGFDEDSDEYTMDAPVEWTLLTPFNHNVIKGYAGSPSSGTDNPQIQSHACELVESFYLDVTGRLIGGCIDVLDWIIGTPYEDLTGFAERYKDDGLIWFFDPFELSPLQLQYTVRKLQLMGLFDNAKAVIFGRVFLTGDATDIDYLNQLERVFAASNVPIIWGADIGHTKPSMTLINGAIAHITLQNGNATLSMELR